MTAAVSYPIDIGTIEREAIERAADEAVARGQAVRTGDLLVLPDVVLRQVLRGRRVAVPDHLTLQEVDLEEEFGLGQDGYRWIRPDGRIVAAFRVVDRHHR